MILFDRLRDRKRNGSYIDDYYVVAVMRMRGVDEVVTPAEEAG